MHGDPNGKNVLVTVSYFAGTTTASIAYATSGGAWEWGTYTDSWNTDDMQGTLMPHEGFVAGIDKVQVR